MIDNTVTVKTDSGGIAEVYLSRIADITDEYIAGLDEPSDIYKQSRFMGLLKTLYVKLFRPAKSMRYNSNTLLVDAEPEVISDLWDIFASLCYKYGQTPTILKFATLTGIDRHAFTDWRDGVYRGSNPLYRATSLKMLQESECALESKAVESNGIGSIFALKACHKWREAAPILPESSLPTQLETAEQIAARHGYEINSALSEEENKREAIKYAFRDAVKPEPPDFNED